MEKIKVALRMRPFSKKEQSSREELGWNMDMENNMTTAQKEQYYSKPFIFDYCFNAAHKNEDVYQACCKDIVLSAMDGINTTLFVYGQTGAGKTHTMLGPPAETLEQRYTGIIFQSLEDVFDKVKASKEEQFYFTCSYIEIYNEMIYDLLSKADALNDHLMIYEDVANQKFKVKNQTKVRIESLEDILKILTYGEQNRKYAETYFNHKSSRSHTIFSVYIQNIKNSPDDATFIKEGVLNFVDLAGCERLLYNYNINKGYKGNTNRNNSFKSDFYGNKTIEKNLRLNESKSINKSLFFLTQVIFLASKGKKTKHIPFRNSPLTKILRSSFGGNSRTLLVLNISPCLSDFEISLSTLRFGRCAKKIENVIKTNIVAGYNKEALQKIVDTYEKRIAEYKEKVTDIQDKQAKMMEFLGNFGAFSEKFMEKMMKQVGDAKGDISSLVGKGDGGFGQRVMDADKLRKMRAWLRGDRQADETVDGRLYVDFFKEDLGILYKLNDDLFDGELEEAERREKQRQGQGGDSNAIESGGKGNKKGLRAYRGLKSLRDADGNGVQMDGIDTNGDSVQVNKDTEFGPDKGDYIYDEEGVIIGGRGIYQEDKSHFQMRINGEVRAFKKFLVYDEMGNAVYAEDIFDEESGEFLVDEHFAMYDNFGNSVVLEQLIDSEGKVKLLSRANESNLRNELAELRRPGGYYHWRDVHLNSDSPLFSGENSKEIQDDRSNRVLKALRKAMKQNWRGEKSGHSIETEKILAPLIFEKFKEKLDREEILEKTCKDFFEEIRIYLQEMQEVLEGTTMKLIKEQMQMNGLFGQKRVQEMSDVKRRLEFYEKPKRIKRISDAEIDEFSLRIKKMARVYQEEKMRRKIVKELRSDNPQLVVNLGELDEDMIGLGNVKREIAENDKFFKRLNENFVKNFKVVADFKEEKSVLEILEDAERRLSKEVDEVYEDNYNIQNFFYQYSSMVEKNSKVLDNKVMFLTEQLTQKFIKGKEVVLKDGPREKGKLFRVWGRRLSLRDLKGEDKREFFKNLKNNSKSDVLFLYKNIQNKLETFMKMQGDVGRLGNVNTADQIKDIIASFDQKNKTEADPNKAETEDEEIHLEEEDEDDSADQEEEEYDGNYETPIFTESNLEDIQPRVSEYSEETLSKKPKQKRKRQKEQERPEKEDFDHNYSERIKQKMGSKKNNKNLENVYGIKKNFVDKYTPYMSENPRKRVASTTSANNLSKDHYMSHDNRSKSIPDEIREGQMSYVDDETDEYEEVEADMDSINDSEMSDDESSPLDMQRGYRQQQDEQEYEYEDDEEVERVAPRNGHDNSRNNQPRNADLEAYYKNIAQGN